MVNKKKKEKRKEKKEMSEETRTRYFKGYGQVQRVMFRQTFIRAAQRRGLVAGASNSKGDINEVTFTLSGDNNKIEEILQFFREKSKIINDFKNVIDNVFNRID